MTARRRVVFFLCLMPRAFCDRLKIAAAKGAKAGEERRLQAHRHRQKKYEEHKEATKCPRVASLSPKTAESGEHARTSKHNCSVNNSELTFPVGEIAKLPRFARQKSRGYSEHHDECSRAGTDGPRSRSSLENI
jgi:hypothetical protein